MQTEIDFILTVSLPAGNLFRDQMRKKKCKVQYITKHILKKFVEYNHSPAASASSVMKIIHKIKTQAQETRDRPCQVIRYPL